MTISRTTPFWTTLRALGPRAIRRAVLALMLLPVLILPANAQALVDTERLDTLFAALPYAQDQQEADEIAFEIWDEWTHPSDPQLARRMDASAALSQSGAIPQAMAVLDTIVMEWPDYAEGWNRRATLHFVLRQYDAALADIEETLDREPRHFGALSGRVEIELAQGDREKARETMIEALEIHPYLAGRERFDDLPAPMVRI